MKKVIYLMTLVLVLVGCSKRPDKVLPKKAGLWNYTTKITTSSTSSTNTTTEVGVAKFDDQFVHMTWTSRSGTLFSIPFTDLCEDSDCTTSYNWYYNKESETIHVSTLGDFKVETMESKKEVWKLSYTDGSVTYSTEVSLEKLK